MLGPFSHYDVEPVFFRGSWSNRGLAEGKRYKTIERARLEAISIIKKNKNPDEIVKGYIIEHFEGRSVGFEVEKVYRLTDYKTKKSRYYMEIIGKKTYVYRLNTKTGAIAEQIRKKDL